VALFFTRAIAKNAEMLVARQTEILFQDNAQQRNCGGRFRVKTKVGSVESMLCVDLFFFYILSTFAIHIPAEWSEILRRGRTHQQQQTKLAFSIAQSRSTERNRERESAAHILGRQK
jgi:hypothetical protein